MKKLYIIFGFGLLIFGLSALTVGCGSSGTTSIATTTTTVAGTTTSTSSTTTTTSGSAAGTATISGQVAISSSDLVASGITSFSIIQPKFRTLANTVASGSAVSLIYYDENGTASSAATASTTTDGSGNYSFSNVPVITSGFYKVIADKTVGNDTIEVTSIAVPLSATTETTNIGPESTIAVEMFDDVIRNDSAISNLTVDQELLKEAMGILVDENEQLVSQGDLTLASMKKSNSGQIINSAAGIAENRGNTNKAFSNLKNSVKKNNVVSSSDRSEAIKIINEITVKAAGQNYMPKKEANKVFAEALVDNEIKTVDQALTAIASAASAPIDKELTIASLEASLNSLQTKIDNIIAGTSQEVISESTYFGFSKNDRTGTITASTTLDAIKQVSLLTFVKEKGFSVDDMKFSQQLHPQLYTGLGISSTEPYFDEVGLYYGSYGGWKVGGRVSVHIPSSSSLTVSRVELVGTTVATLSADGDNYRLANSNGPTISTSSTGVTNNLTLRAVMSDSSVVTKLLTYEGYTIPSPNLFFLGGQQVDDSNAETSMGSGLFQLTSLQAVSDIRPIFVWSTSEVSSLSIPSGYSWAYAVEISLYGATLESNSGNLTWEIHSQNKYGTENMLDSDRSTYEYTSNNDYGKMFTNSSFISPVDFTETYNGDKVAYRFYLQRVLLDDEGKYHGIAAGHFKFLRYAP